MTWSNLWLCLWIAPFWKSPPSFPNLLWPFLFCRRYNRFLNSLCDPHFNDSLRRYFDLRSRTRITSQAFFPFGGTGIRIPFRKLTYNHLLASRRVILFLPNDLPFSWAAQRPYKIFLPFAVRFCLVLLHFHLLLTAWNLRFLRACPCSIPPVPRVSHCPAQSIPYSLRQWKPFTPTRQVTVWIHFWALIRPALCRRKICRRSRKTLF